MFAANNRSARICNMNRTWLFGTCVALTLVAAGLGVAADSPAPQKVKLGSPELTAGIPGIGKLRVEEVKACTQFAIDLFHPNDHGYRVWADAFAPSLAAQLVERFETPDVAPADVVGAA